MTEPSTSQSRIFFLDALRGLAALTVFVFHAISVTSEPFASFSRQQFDLGYCGVVIFFFCSGFIIPLTIERQQSATRFLVRRVFRIYPLYWFSLAIYLCYYLTGHTMPGSVSSADWQAHGIATVLVNVALLQHLLHFPNLISTSWTLTYELIFYGLVAMLFSLRLLHRTIPLTLSLIALALVFDVLLPRWNIVLDPLHIGLYLAMMSVGTVVQRAAAGMVRTRAAVGLALVLLITHSLVPDISRAYLHAAVVGTAVFGLGYGLRDRPSPRILLDIGQISYSLYLLHVLVIAMVPRLISVPLALLVWLIVALPVSILTEQWVERPGIALGRWLTRAPR